MFQHHIRLFTELHEEQHNLQKNPSSVFKGACIRFSFKTDKIHAAKSVSHRKDANKETDSTTFRFFFLHLSKGDNQEQEDKACVYVFQLVSSRYGMHVVAFPRAVFPHQLFLDSNQKPFAARNSRNHCTNTNKQRHKSSNFVHRGRQN